MAHDLKCRFGPSDYYDAEVAINQHVQTTSVHAYIIEFVKLSASAPLLVGPNLLKRFIAGLKPDIHHQLVLLKPTELETAMGIARIADDKIQSLRRLTSCLSTYEHHHTLYLTHLHLIHHYTSNASPRLRCRPVVKRAYASTAMRSSYLITRVTRVSNAYSWKNRAAKSALSLLRWSHWKPWTTKRLLNKPCPRSALYHLPRPPRSRGPLHLEISCFNPWQTNARIGG
ncbi:hypothetical protein QQ045_013519 [Rhodiola kirilowii]